MEKNWWKSCIANYFLIFLPILMKFAQLCALGCRCARHIFGQCIKCIAMVMAYYEKIGESLRRELLPQFLTNSHEIWHRCLPWGVDVQDTFMDNGRKCVAMVMAYYGKNWGESCVVNYFLSF